MKSITEVQEIRNIIRDYLEYYFGNDNLTDLVDDSMADSLHRHSELSASDGTPNPAIQVDASGYLTLNTNLKIYYNDAGYIMNIANTDLVIGTNNIARMYVKNDGKFLISYTDNNSAGVPAIAITKNFTGSAINQDNIRDTSTINPSAANAAFCSFDTSVDAGGTYDYNHLASYQDRMTFNGSGIVNNHWGFFSGPTYNSGTITNRFGALIYDPNGVGVVTNNYGVYVTSMVRGTTLNYAIYTAGTTKSLFGGNVGIGVDPSNKLHVLSTSTQLRLGYDADSYATLGVANGGNLSITCGEATGDIRLTPGSSNKYVYLLGGATLTLASSDSTKYGTLIHDGTNLVLATTGATPGNIVISNTTACTGANTGALQVAGGAYVAGSEYIGSDCSALTFTDRTPYPLSLALSYEAIDTVKEKDGKLDKDALHAILKSGEDGRDLSMTVSVLSDITKDLIKRIDQLEKKK